MRRLTRHVFTACSAASLLLLAATCVLWVRSYGRSDRFAWRGEYRWCSVRTAMGSVAVDVATGIRLGVIGDPPGLSYHRDIPFGAFNNLGALNVDHDDTVFDWQRGPFAWYSYQSGRSGYYLGNGAAPCWSLTAASGALPLVWAGACAPGVIARRRRRRRERAGLCGKCGYDLRTTPDASGPSAARCPECGTAAAARS